MVRVLYIMGLYRSGSTILDIVLGNQAGLTGVGELRNLPLSGWDHGGACACGQPADRCLFWQEVRADWERAIGANRVARLAALQDEFERLRSLPRLVVQRSLGRTTRSFREYCSLLVPLYEAILRVSGSQVIVDSTKYPGRALALLDAPGVDLRIVHLVRDGRAVIWSMKRKMNTDLKGEVLEVDPARIAGHTTQHWLLTNLASSAVVRLAGQNAIRVRYEDFVENPRQQLDRIGQLVGVSFEEVADRVSDGRVLEIGHTIAGNRVRMGGDVRLRADTEWLTRLDAADRSTFWRSAGWLARRYGYPKT